MSNNSSADYMLPDVNTDEISPKQLIRKIKQWYSYLLSKWTIIIGLGIIGGICDFIYASLQKPIFIATTTFVLESGESGGGSLAQYAGLASAVGIDLGGSGGGIFQGDNIIELYRSRTMIEKTLYSPINNSSKELLIDRYIKVNQLRNSWAGKSELLSLDFSKEANSSNRRLIDSILGRAVEDISKNYLSVGKPDKKLSILKVDVRSKDEEFSKVFNEELVKNVNSFYLTTKTKKSMENVRILEAKTDSIRRTMNSSIYTAATVADATPNLNPTRQTLRIAPAQKAQLSTETNKAILSSLIQNLELSKLTLLKETPLIQTVDVPIYPLNQEKLGRIKSGLTFGILLIFLTITALLLKKVFNELI